MPVTRLDGPFGKWTTSQSSLILSRTPGMLARTAGNMATLLADQAPPGPPTVLRKLVGAQWPETTLRVRKSKAVTASGESIIDLERSAETNWPPAARTAGT